MAILKRIAHNPLRQDRSLKEGIANKAAGGGLEQELPAPCPMRVYRTGNELLLWGQRLSAGGAYEDIAPLYMVGGQPIYHSDKLGAFCMLDEGGNIHTLQTWDEERGVWLDPVRARDLDADEDKQEAVQEAVQDTALTTSQTNFLSQLKLRAA